MPRKRLIVFAAAAVTLAVGVVAWANVPDSPPLPVGAVADRVVW
jgi:hypothetical protein